MHYYKIISISRPILARANMGLDFVSCQYGCLFSRCRKYVINSLIHGHFHIGLVIIHRPILVGMITRPIWKCPCINLYVFKCIIVFVYINICMYLNKINIFTILVMLVNYFVSKMHILNTTYLQKYCFWLRIYYKLLSVMWR